MRQGFLFFFIIYLLYCQKKDPFCQDVHSNLCFQLATFNLEFFPSGKKKKLPQNKVRYRMKEMARLWQKEGFDIIAAQEVIAEEEVLKEFSERYLNNQYSYVLGKSGPFEQKVAIFYRPQFFELESFRELNKNNSLSIIDEAKPHWLSPLRLPLEAQFKSKVTNFSFTLIVVHLKSGREKRSCNIRKQQVEDLAKYLSKITVPVIVVGDFNDTLPRKGLCQSFDSLKPLEKLEEKEEYFFTTWPNRVKGGVSFFGNPSSYLIDHIYISTKLRDRIVPLNSHVAEIIFHYDRDLSDHQPVVVWLKL